VAIPLSTYNSLPEIGDRASLHTYLYVKENVLDLVGFATESERDLFELLISVSGIGVRLALTILSGLSVEELLQSLVDEDKTVIARISGVGPKTAGRAVLELKGKAMRYASLAPAMERTLNTQHQEAILALEALGYSRYEAKRAVETAAQAGGSGLSAEELIKAALKVTA
jgi:Holliday junction DNA helicase RuvA